MLAIEGAKVKISKKQFFSIFKKNNIFCCQFDHADSEYGIGFAPNPLNF
jgi:hypothetical protein